MVSYGDRASLELGCSVCAKSKSSGSALDLIIRSWSSVVNRFSFARLNLLISLDGRQKILDDKHTCSGTILAPAVDSVPGCRATTSRAALRLDEPDGRIRS